MIAHRLFKRQFFTHRGTPPTSFHVTIRCNVSCILQPSNFLSILCLPPIDGATILSALLNYANYSHRARIGCVSCQILPVSTVNEAQVQQRHPLAKGVYTRRTFRQLMSLAYLRLIQMRNRQNVTANATYIRR